MVLGFDFQVFDLYAFLTDWPGWMFFKPWLKKCQGLSSLAATSAGYSLLSRLESKQISNHTSP
jgi:hypothetical protein